MWDLLNNQDVGSEAATIQRVRNSSLVERSCAEDYRGSSTKPKLCLCTLVHGVGERSHRAEVVLKGTVDLWEVRMLV